MTSPIISVAVCTHNRADLLESVLDSLCQQAIDIAYYEIIVVDNASTDRTRIVAHEFSKRHPHVRYCFEEKLGHAAARNRGWQEARGKYVAYIDDDALAPENWLSTATTLIQSRQPDLFGGPYHAYYRTPPPRWFKDEYGSSLWKESAHALGENEYLSATNFVIRRDVLATVNGFDPAYGGTGRRLGYAEESDLQYRLRTTLPELIALYEPSLYVWHLVKPEWFSLPFRVKSQFAMGRAHYDAIPNATFRELSSRDVLLRALAKIVLISWQLLLGAQFRKRTHFPYPQNYWYERTLRHFSSLGAYYEHVRSRLNG